jgi:elongation factor G
MVSSLSGRVNVVEVAIAPKTETGLRALDVALDRLRQSHPWIGNRLDTESGQTLLSGPSEDELEQAITAIANIHPVDIDVGQPQVVYRETLSKRVTITSMHKRQMGGAGEFAEVKIEFEPLPSDSGIVFEDEVVGGTVPPNFIPAIEKGLRREAEGGLLIGFRSSTFAPALWTASTTRSTATRSRSRSRPAPHSAS